MRGHFRFLVPLVGVTVVHVRGVALGKYTCKARNYPKVYLENFSAKLLIMMCVLRPTRLAICLVKTSFLFSVQINDWKCLLCMNNESVL